AAPDVEAALHPEPPRRERAHEVVEDLVRHLLEEMALVAERPDVELERLQLHAQPVGHVADDDGAEVRLARDRAQRRVLRTDVADPVVALGRRVRERLERAAGLAGHGGSFPAAHSPARAGPGQTIWAL